MRNLLCRFGSIVAGLAGLALALVACESRPKVEPATLVLTKGKIATVDDQKPEAQALAARGDTIVAVGTNEEIAAFVGPETRVVDLRGRLAIPGFIEGHGHFTGVGEARIVLNLMTREELGRGRGHGEGRRGQGRARRVDPRTGMAPGQVGQEPRAGGGGFPHAPVPECRLARTIPSSSATPAGTPPSPTPRPWSWRG